MTPLRLFYFFFSATAMNFKFTFSGHELPKRHEQGVKNAERTRFLRYCAYALGTPVVVTAVVHSISNTSLIPEEFRIRISGETCWIKGTKTAEFIYVYVPICFVVVFNAIFYSITAYKIHRAGQETSILRRTGSSRHSKMNLDRSR